MEGHLEKIVGGCTGLRFPTIYGIFIVHSRDFGIFSRGIAFLRLSFSTGSFGKRNTLPLLASSKFPLQRDTQYFFPIINE